MSKTAKESNVSEETKTVQGEGKNIWCWIVAANVDVVKRFERHGDEEKDEDEEDHDFEDELISTGLMDDMCDWLEEEDGAPFQIVGNVSQKQSKPWWVWEHQFTTIGVPQEIVIKHCMKFTTGAYTTRSIELKKPL